MKKQLSILTGVLLAGTMLFTSCKKDEIEDLNSPTVTPNGGDKVIDLKSSYTEQGAIANDEKDGDVSATVTMSGFVDINKAGVYTITYVATDKSGNQGSGSRQVTVRHTGATISDPYAVKDSCGTSSTSYTDILTDPTTSRLTVTKFANYVNGAVYFDISGATGSVITVPSQTVVCGLPAATRVFSGSGTVSADGKRVLINYTETTNSTTSSCTGIYTK